MKNNIKKYILGIETTSKICGVALISNSNVLSNINIDNGLTHSVTLFPLIDKVLKTNKISVKDLSLIRVSSGPGSFTGIRIGIACALGLSMSNNIKIEYVDTLKSLYYFIKDSKDKFNYKNIIVINMINAKCDRVYINIYDLSNDLCILDGFIVNVNLLCEMLNKFFINKDVKFILNGDGAFEYKDKFNSNLKINYKLINNDLSGLAIAMTNGISSKKPKLNYMLKSKAERDRIV